MSSRSPDGTWHNWPPPKRCAYCMEAVATVDGAGHDAWQGQPLCGLCCLEVLNEVPVLPGCGRDAPGRSNEEKA